MIYTCIADGIRSPPAFFLKNKYKEPMKMQNENTKRVWLYARIPGNDGETLRCIRECAAKAQQDNCKIVGTSADERYGWLLRPGYREMMRRVKAGEIDCIYIYRMRQISGNEQHLFRFFQQVMQHGATALGCVEIARSKRWKANSLCNNHQDERNGHSQAVIPAPVSVRAWQAA